MPGILSYDMYRFFVLLSFSLTIFSCSDPQPLEVKGYEIVTKAPDSLAIWYEQNLGFKRAASTSPLVLKNAYATINLIKAPEGLAPDQAFPAYFKIGFQMRNLDSLYQHMENLGTSFRGDIVYDDNLNMRTFVSQDLDGNRVQFFEMGDVTEFIPYFFSLRTARFDSALNLYQQEKAFQEAFNLDLPERNFKIRLMYKDGVLLELIGDERATALSHVGIRKISFAN